jgi:PAS domain S-box-containing protein
VINSLGLAPWLAVGSVAALIQEHDWRKTALGAFDAWPRSLRSSLSVMLSSPAPAAVIWGTSAVLLYNDAFATLMGDLHPSALGQDYRKSWAAQFSEIETAYQAAWQGRNAHVENARGFVSRFGSLEESWCSCAFSPIFDERGATAGLFAAVADTSTIVLSDRRASLVTELSTQCRPTRNAAELFSIVSRVLEQAPLDVPFAAFYQVSADLGSARLIASTVGAAQTQLPRDCTLDERDDPWQLRKAVVAAGAVKIEALRETFVAGSVGPYPEPPKEALAIRIAVPDSDGSALVMVVGVSARLPCDSAYLAFVDLLASCVSMAVRSLGGYERQLRAANDRPAQFVSTEIVALTTQVAEEFRPAMQAANLQFEVHCEPITLGVDLDRQMWSELLRILLANALQFTRAGRVVLTLRARGQEVALSVEDTGEGIGPEKRALLFTRFHPAPQVPVRAGAGSGLGLLCASDLVRAHRGQIRVQSAVGRGSTFEVLLPFARDHVADARESAALLEASTRPPPRDSQSPAQSSTATEPTALFDAAMPATPFEKFFQLSLDMLCIAGTDGYFRMLSPAWATLGYTIDEFLARPFVEFIHPDDVPATFAEVAKLAQGAPTVYFENRYRSKTRGYRWFAWTAASDATGAIYAIARDITEEKQNAVALLQAKERAEIANRELESFSYSVAHDLRAPLRSIDGFSQALLEECFDKLDAEGRQHLTYVRESAQQMGRLIDDLLSLSRVARSELRMEPIDMSALALNSLRLLKRAHRERTVEVVVQPDVAARGDQRLIGVLLDNLLSNAWKFTNKTEHARIEFGTQVGADRQVEYFVKDNGAGFDMKFVHKLFGVFQRIHSSSEFEGTGIGLATVQRIVARHGGRVRAEGAVGRGATFLFTLPTVETMQ